MVRGVIAKPALVDPDGVDGHTVADVGGIASVVRIQISSENNPGLVALGIFWSAERIERSDGFQEKAVTLPEASGEEV